MTRVEREEAIKNLKEQQNEFNEHYIDYAGINKAYNMAIKALEQDPCDNCIGRAKAIEEVDKLCLETAYDNEKVIEMLNDLPSTIPKEKTGKWIDDGFYAEGHSEIVYRCSQCNHCIIELSIEEYNFCPNCGCHMVEPKESEDKR